MNHDRHQPGRHTWRIVLARLCLDAESEQIVAAQIGGCADCWRAVAGALADWVAIGTMLEMGIPDMTASGLVEGLAVDYAAHRVDAALRAAALDARNWEVLP